MFVPPPNVGHELQVVRTAWQERVTAPIDQEVLRKIKGDLDSKIHIYKEARPIGAAPSSDVALSRLNAADADLEESVNAMRDTPREQYRDDVYAELRLHRSVALERDPELHAMIAEWKTSGVKPSEFASAANEFEFSLAGLRNYRYQTIRKPSDDATP